MRVDFEAGVLASHPELSADKLFSDNDNRFRYEGFVDRVFRFVSEKQLMRTELWARFVQQFREDADYDAGWRGEYWGKMMRGACFVYAYTRDPALYRVLCDTVCDLMTTADENGRISTYHVSHELDGWDLWGRKYVLLGMQYFFEICEDEVLRERIVRSMCAQMDEIIAKVGAEKGKKPITSCTRHWRGLNSSSLLEPVVRLYRLTGRKAYFDFSKYIVDGGGTDVENIFKLAYEDRMYPYQYPVTKAYEMMSCFEGLLEFYRITGEPWYRDAVIRFADKILESDFTVTGCCGCTHELFDHSTVRQANTTNGAIQQETCVTVTLMKLLHQLTCLTGNAKYADAFERSFYNAYLGSLNTEDVTQPTVMGAHPDWVIEPLPFDSYSPLTAGTRGNGIGGLKVMSDRHYYGCCACIGAAGIGLVPKMQIMSCEDGFAINLYIRGSVRTRTPSGREAVFTFDTAYPKHGKVDIELRLQSSERFRILLRNPCWSKETAVFVDQKRVDICDGYIEIEREWRDRERITLILDMRTEILRPVSYGSQILMNKVVWGANMIVPTFDAEDPLLKYHIALRRGPIMLARDSRLGDCVEDAIPVLSDGDYAKIELIADDAIPFDAIVAAQVPLADGSHVTVVDYSSAGKLWSKESRMAVWLRRIEPAPCSSPIAAPY